MKLAGLVSRRDWRRAAPPFVLCLVPLAAHLPELLGIVDTNPLLQGTALALHPESALLSGKPFIDAAATTIAGSLGRLSADSWLHLQLPWWNPYTGVGLPLASMMQPFSFFLPFVLLLHFAQGVLLLKLTMQVLTGFFCLAFLRRIMIAAWPATLASVLFQCNGTFAFYDDAPFLPIAFLPLLFLGIEQARERTANGQAGGVAVIALAIGYSLLAGFPETAFVDGLLGLAWAVLRANGLGARGALNFATRIAGGGVIGLALASPVLLPFLQDLGSGNLGFSRDAFVANAHLPPEALPLLLLPYLRGPPQADFTWVAVGGFIGTVSPLLALSARSGPRGARTLLLSWLVVGTAAAAGAPVIEQAVRMLPGLDRIVIRRYGMPSFSFCACVLTSFALNGYFMGRRQRMAVPVCIVGLAVLASLAVGFSGSFLGAGHEPGTQLLGGLSVAWGVAAPLVLSLLLSVPAGAVRYGAVSAIVLVDAIGLFIPPSLTGLRQSGLFEAPIVFLQTHAALNRVVSVGGIFWPNAGAYFRFGLLDYFYVPVPELWASHVSHKLDPGSLFITYPNLFETPRQAGDQLVHRWSALQELGVRYVVAPTSLDLFHATSGQVTAARIFRQRGVDIFELVSPKPYAETHGGPCRLVVADREHMQADCAASAHLLRRELFSLGWHARLNGRRAGISAASDIFQDIELPAGRSEIVWRYVPENANAIALLFAAGSIGLAASAIWDRRRHSGANQIQLGSTLVA